MRLRPWVWLLVGGVIGLLLLGLWGRVTLSRREAEWQARTDSLLTTQREEWVVVTGRL